jgi:hypothetical protein
MSDALEVTMSTAYPLVHRRAALALAAIGLAALAGCATQEGFAYLSGYRWQKAELNTFDVQIISVDGKHYIERKGQPVMIEPGLRTIVVQGPPTAGFTYGEQRTLKLDVQPCTRYWLEAKKANALSQDFEPRVNYSEPIAGCTPPKK